MADRTTFEPDPDVVEILRPMFDTETPAQTYEAAGAFLAMILDDGQGTDLDADDLGDQITDPILEAMLNERGLVEVVSRLQATEETIEAIADGVERGVRRAGTDDHS